MTLKKLCRANKLGIQLISRGHSSGRDPGEYNIIILKDLNRKDREPMHASYRNVGQLMKLIRSGVFK
jgi:ABC-type tungstate transport system permease subunit